LVNYGFVKLPPEDCSAAVVNGYVLVLGAVLREVGQDIWQPYVAKRLKQPVGAVAAFSPAWLADNGEMRLTVWRG
jgi:hypothetical protein